MMTARVFSGAPFDARIDRLMIVTADDGLEVKVRWRHTRTHIQIWHCYVHGQSDTASCDHILAAATALAADMFGLVVGYQAVE
jgi:hypothetical protein